MSLAFVVTIAMMFVLRPVAIHIGLVDHPGGRKRHDRVVPVVGGAAMFIGGFTGVVLLPLPPNVFVHSVSGACANVECGK